MRDQLSNTESNTNDSATEEEEPEETEVESITKKVIKTSKTVQEDYEKMVQILQKQTGIKDKDLEGMTWKEKFDKLSFFAEHIPKQVSKNKPPVGTPIETGKRTLDGITIEENPVSGRKSYVVDPTKLFKIKPKE